MLHRRDFLRSASLLSLAPTVPGFLARTARAAKPQTGDRVLVIIQLDGGNDGINTVVPFADEGYAKHRKVLRISRNQVLKVNDRVGLHPALGGFAKLLEAGRLAVVQGVGYPNPNRSHFRSMAIWQTARLNPDEGNGLGWLGRALDNAAPPTGGAPAGFIIGQQPPPVALRGRRAAAAALANLDDFTLSLGHDAGRAVAEPAAADDLAAFVYRSTLDAYATAGQMDRVLRAEDTGPRYPATGLADRLRLIARLLKTGCGTRVFYTLQGSYDTHYAQAQLHYNLLSELAGAVRAFLDDLAAAKLADRVAVLAFSEFGRRVQENGSQGTEFLAGPHVRPGLHGQTPSLQDLQDSDLKVQLDFRRVYAAVLRDWLGLPSQAALGAELAPLPLFRV